jgi:protoporphyrinogen oxidase
MTFDSSCRKKVGIIGAGPAGLAAGYQLAKKGACVHIFEKSDQVGGLSKTIDLWGQKVDIGPHRFFSSDTRVNKLWLEIAGQDYVMVNRLTRIYYNKKFFYYPIRIFDVLTKLGLFTSSLCLLSYFKELLIPLQSNGSFENWVTNRFGKRLYSIFFKSYTEKLWGIPCSEIDSDFAAQRIQKLSLAEAVKNALKIGGKTYHKTLVDRFAYPINGTGMIYERMKNFIEERGGRVYLTTPVQRVLTKNKTAYGIQINNTVHEYDDIVSSMPLTATAEII